MGGGSTVLDAILNEKMFIIACKKGDAGKVRVALRSGVDPDSTDQYGHSGLIWAARKGWVEVATILLGSGANIEFPDVRGRTPVFHAVCFNKRDIIQMLAKHGANLDVVDSNRCTPCKFAELEGNQELVELLVSLGAKSGAATNKFLEINIGFDNLYDKDGRGHFWVGEIVPVIQNALREIEIGKVDKELESVCVWLRVGIDVSVQPVDYEDRAVSTEVGVPKCEDQGSMNVAVVAAVSSGYEAIGDFLEKQFRDSFDHQRFRDETQAVFEKTTRNLRQ